MNLSSSDSNMQTATSLLRGPCIVAFSIFAILLPYLPSMPVSLLLEIMGVGFGMILSSRDFFLFGEKRLKKLICELFDSIVLDDVLRAIYDPIDGWIAALFGSYIGNFAMYTLPMNSEQRTRLVQASLWSEEGGDSVRSIHDARSILQHPGGCKLLLPKKLRDWLKDGEEVESSYAESPLELPRIQRTNQHSQATVHTELVDTESSLAESVPSYDGNPSGNRAILEQASSEAAFRQGVESNSRGVNFSNLSQLCKEHESNDAEKENHHSLPGSLVHTGDPMQVMFSILKEIGHEHMHRWATDVPESALETVGISAGMVVVAHLIWRKQPRRYLLGVIEGLLAVTLSSISIGALSASAVRHAVLRNKVAATPEGQHRQHTEVKTNGRLCELLRGMLPRNSKRFLAIVVLLILGRKRLKNRLKQ